MIITNLFITAENVPVTVNLSEAQKLKVAEKELRKPFFIKSKDDRSVFAEKVISIENSQFPRDANFDKKIKNYLNNEFYIIRIDSTDTRASNMLQSKKSWIDNYILNDEVWYQFDFDDDFLASKMTIFLNYYNCRLKNSATKTFVKCFQIYIYNFRNENWFVTSAVGNQDEIRWKNDTAYAEIQLDKLEDFTRLTNARYLVVPLPRDSKPIYYIKYEADRFSLVKGPDSDWMLINQQKYEKFQKWVSTYKVKHGETPDP